MAREMSEWRDNLEGLGFDALCTPLFQGKDDFSASQQLDMETGVMIEECFIDPTTPNFLA